jgi:hypothetical protein
MLNRNRMKELDKRDEMILTLIAIMIPLVTLPAMVG